MNAPAAPRGLLARSRVLLWLAGGVLALAFSLASVPNNPLGFFIDESSIAYNAYTISRSASDEYGTRWPLYFRAFDEYKNPTYIYLLAGLFKVFGPSIWLARLLSAIVGLSAAVLLALGLLFFAQHPRWPGIIRTWIIYGVLLLPLLLFSQRHPGAFTARFHELSYIRPDSTFLGIAGEVIGHVLENLSLRSLLVVADANVRHHVPGMGSMLAATVVLAAVGLVLRRHWRKPWWQFVLYGLVVSVVPAFLTTDQFHTLRLVAIPVFLLVLTVPAIAWLGEGGESRSARRAMLALLVLLTLLQAAVFQRQFHREGPKLGYAFDAGFPEVFTAATALQSRPMYLIAGPGRYTYIHAYWYGTLEGMEASEFVRLSAGERPPGQSLVIGDMFGEPCVRCQIILMRPPYVVYRAL